MAGIEQLEVHSRSYILRWVKVDQGHTISWSLQPHKKSLNFGIVKHPGNGATNPTVAEDSTQSLTNTSTEAKVSASASSRFGRRDNTAQDQLLSKGFLSVAWHGRCEADKVTMGTYNVLAGQGGMFGLVFDNTFSKQTSKTATFVLLTYPTAAPPPTNHLSLNHLSTGNPSSISSSTNPTHAPNAASAVTSAAASTVSTGGSVQVTVTPATLEAGAQNLSIHDTAHGGTDHGDPSQDTSENAPYHVGMLRKRRRKKGQGYAHRFFSLDFTSCTLSYYQNRNSSALRGAIPLSLAAITADEIRREISIDSGAEIWHLRASNASDFRAWARALERASRIARHRESAPTGSHHRHQHHLQPSGAAKPSSTCLVSREEEEKEWKQMETLVSQVVGTRDALYRLVQDWDEHYPKQKQQQQYLNPRPSTSSVNRPKPYPSVEDERPSTSSSSADSRRPPFWKRKTSGSLEAPTVSTRNGSNGDVTVVSPGSIESASMASNEQRQHCQALVADLDHTLSEFQSLLSTSQQRRQKQLLQAQNRHSFAESRSGSHSGRHSPLEHGRRSMDTVSTEEFFDAEDGDDGSATPKIMHIRSSDDIVDAEQEQTKSNDDDDDDEEEDDDGDDGSSIASDQEEEPDVDGHWYPPKPKTLSPLPVVESVRRRSTIPPSTVQPPSLIAFVRKNVGKDLSTISMPVSANEPLSLLQRVSEQLEYASLLDKASQEADPHQRLLYVTAFAISQFSVNRERERAVRKPFNPLLGETFELVRSEAETPGGFRLLVEKVCHRPVRLALQADSTRWSLSQSPTPGQKFWGKSAEITTEGRVRLVLRLNPGGENDDVKEERYSWSIATMFLRNVVMGEKYVEPVGTMHVVSETTGAKGSIEFRSKGMFGGRSEDVHVDIVQADGASLGLGLMGTWTQGIRKTVHGKATGEVVWQAGSLVENAGQTYGFPIFTAQMNQITELERDSLPPTDTRLRPDQRLAEEGQLDAAESVKARLEEAQRERRRKMEARGDLHTPKWFTLAGTDTEGAEVWKLKTGREGYWDERQRGAWTGLERIFDV